MDRQKPVVTEEVINYIKHCIFKAIQKRGKNATIMDHQTFAAMALEKNSKLVLEFLRDLELK
jgi:hypothetical protein